ncbi:MAG: hypothetical protein FWD85_11150 [Microbacteriaceae bacterium]|nr:hypothetical protein [Microbacteriaceae bacterium]
MEMPRGREPGAAHHSEFNQPTSILQGVEDRGNGPTFPGFTGYLRCADCDQLLFVSFPRGETIWIQCRPGLPRRRLVVTTDASTGASWGVLS